MPTDPSVDAADCAGLVGYLADPVRAKQAFHRLVGFGPEALPAVRAGLDHDHPEVRMHCARALDHLVDETSWSALIAMLEDPDGRVRAHTLHAIACDRCKEGTEPPHAGEVLPPAVAILESDPSYHVRAMAVEVVARYVHTEPAALHALERAHSDDPSPMVRKKAGWFVPGGPRFEKTRPRT